VERFGAVAGWCWFTKRMGRRNRRMVLRGPEPLVFV
jgi:hypothetical protein